MIILTFVLIRALRSASKFRQQMTPESSSESQDTNTMLIVVVIICIVCQPWEPVRRIMEALLGRQPSCPHYYFYYEEFPSLSFAINSAANFVVYCLLGSKFRRALKQSLCFTSKKQNETNTGNTNTNTSVVTDGKI